VYGHKLQLNFGIITIALSFFTVVFDLMYFVSILVDDIAELGEAEVLKKL
jgi:hypothetical protein